jgi:HprK-related kinase A
MSASSGFGRTVRVGPFAFRLRSPLREVIGAVERLYRDYPAEAEDGVADYVVTVLPPSPLRRWLRPKLVLACDVEIPLMAPVPRAHGLLALEMGMNLQLAAGMHRFLLLHAAAAERDGGGLVLTGDSGAGKSTLAAYLGYNGWRFLGDEFALLEPADGLLRPFPRPVSLKNASIDLLRETAPADRFGPRFESTIKGTIQHLLPPAEAVAAMDVPARPRLVVAPNFAAGARPLSRRLSRSEAFVRLSQASTNYRSLGEAGFEALWRLVDTTPAYEIAYGSSQAAAALIDELWAAHG